MTTTKIVQLFKDTIRATKEYSETTEDLINDTTIGVNEKATRIVDLKSKLHKNTESDILSDNFYVDGSIKINQEELRVLDIDLDLEDTLSNVSYKVGEDLVFRGHNYYFLFDSLDIKGIKKGGSVNNYKIIEANIEQLFSDILNHYSHIKDLIYYFCEEKNTIPEDTLKKIILGLLDAKNNITSFIQNISEIMSNQNFLNPDFTESLVFGKGLSREIKSVYGKLPKDHSNKNQYNEIIALLDDYKSTVHPAEIYDNLSKDCMYYSKLLMGDTSVFLDILNNREYNTDDYTIDVINKSSKFMGECLNLIDDYTDITISKMRNKPKSRPTKIKRDFLNKLIRLYREENDPLIMIQTTINAYFSLLNRGFEPHKDQIDIYSVNYGGATIGSYIKPILDLLINSNGVSTGVSNVVYSNYDLNNKADNLNFRDYPCTLELRKKINITKTSVNTILSGDYEKLFLIRKFDNSDGKKWGIIFDDNTHSGSTLSELQGLLAKENVYDEILPIACRSTSDIGDFNDSIPDDFKLTLMRESGTRARTYRNKFGYQELVGKIVGRRIYMESNKK